MLTNKEIVGYLERLDISQTEAAQLLGVTPRTVRRWIAGGQDISGPAEQALRAWLRLNDMLMPWHPNSVSILEEDIEQIAAHRNHAIELSALLTRVEKRGGPAAPWVVDLEKSKATLGPISVSFYKLRNGGFSPQLYTRRDIDPDRERDWGLIEDAFYCIAQAISADASA